MAIILFDNQFRTKLFPLTATKAVADLRLGILKIKDWWQLETGQEVWIHTVPYLQPLYNTLPAGEHIWIDASVLPTKELAERILLMGSNNAIADDCGLIAGKASINPKDFNTTYTLQHFNTIINTPIVNRIEFPHHLFQLNDAVLRQQFELITKNKTSQPIDSSNTIIGAEHIFIESGASINYSLLNASTGPIYIGKNATIMEGCIIRGPFAICDNATLKMGAKVYGATTIGVQSVGGGEIKNSIIGDYSNKAHDGYLGDSVLGEWCNMGAGTSNSNIKNTAAEVKLWNYYSNTYEPAGMKCGVIMGSYSRAAINSSINTGSSIGVCCNVFGEGLLPTLINDFSWGTKPAIRYELHKAIKDIGNWMHLKGKQLSSTEISVLQYIFDQIEQ
jgi:UDP-N-acetylglucosamine diphosphorylase/glucosamine-1-phosphate N-acetyltransferase